LPEFTEELRDRFLEVQAMRNAAVAKAKGEPAPWGGEDEGGGVMGATTGISWCDATFNPWRGCTKISPGCAHCYAEAMSVRNPKVLGEWGDHGTRVIASESYWRQPLKWDREAREAGVRRRVFCASLADVFEIRADLVEPRQRLFDTIARTPNLDWLLLTKRPEAATAILQDHVFIPNDDGRWRVSAWEGMKFGLLGNVWLGTTVENQEYADERIPILLQIPAAVRFLSVEPLLGPVDLERVYSTSGGTQHNVGALQPGRISWVICGGESGGKARPFDLAWARSIRDQCKAAGVPYFAKQMGSNAVDGGRRFPTEDRHGADISEFPEDLRIQEFPR
jgi:protein gp37